MKICKDGRIWGQNNKEAENHLGILAERKLYIKKDGSESKRSRSECKKGSKNPNFGKKINNSGSSNPNWKGGISSQAVKIRNQIEFRLWRQAVYVRDNWTCQECGKRGGLNAHHIKSFKQYPELRFAIDNGKTLCLKCHKLINNFSGEVRIA